LLLSTKSLSLSSSLGIRITEVAQAGVKTEHHQ
jgi:hypothetical protein